MEEEMIVESEGRISDPFDVTRDVAVPSTAADRAAHTNRESDSSDCSESDDSDDPRDAVIDLEVDDEEGYVLISSSIESRISRDRVAKNLRVPQERLKRKRKLPARVKVEKLIKKKGVEAMKSKALALVKLHPHHQLTATAEGFITHHFII
jgi:hypothetical protein